MRPAGILLLTFTTMTVANGCCPITWDGPFEGRIVDAKTGKAISGAVIGAFWYRGGPWIGHDWIEPYAGQDSITDDEGRFRINGIRGINWLPFSCVEEPMFTIFARGYHGCDMISEQAIGGCGQPEVRLTPTTEPQPQWAHGSVDVSGGFERFVPRMVATIRSSRKRSGASPKKAGEDSPPWSTFGSSP